MGRRWTTFVRCFPSRLRLGRTEREATPAAPLPLFLRNALSSSAFSVPASLPACQPTYSTFRSSCHLPFRHWLLLRIARPRRAAPAKKANQVRVRVPVPHLPHTQQPPQPLLIPSPPSLPTDPLAIHKPPPPHDLLHSTGGGVASGKPRLRPAMLSIPSMPCLPLPCLDLPTSSLPAVARCPIHPAPASILTGPTY
jgi:hypothetical protein